MENTCTPWILPLVLAKSLFVVVRLADGEEVRPEPADGVLGHLGEEEGGEGPQGEEAEVTVQLYSNPGDRAAGDWQGPTNGLIVALMIRLMIILALLMVLRMLKVSIKWMIITIF